MSHCSLGSVIDVRIRMKCTLLGAEELLGFFYPQSLKYVSQSSENILSWKELIRIIQSSS